MIKKPFLIPCVTILVLFSLFLVGCAPASATGTATGTAYVPTTYYVALDGDDANPCTSTDRPCQTVYAAYAKASSYDSIQVAEGRYRLEDPTSPGLRIAKTITIIGAGRNLTIFEPELTNYSTIHVHGGVLFNLSHATVLGPSDAGGLTGAVIVDSGGDLTVRDCLIHESSQLGIYNNGGTVRIASSTMQGNVTNIYNFHGEMEIRDSTISSSGRTGVINDGGLSIYNTTVENSGSGNFNDGISNKGELYMEDSRIENNGATGLVVSAGGRAELHNVTAVGNEQNIWVKDDSTLLMFDSHIEGSNMGTLVEAGGYVSVTQSNYATNHIGIENQGGEVEFHRSALVQNGGIAILNNSGDVTIEEESRIQGNGYSEGSERFINTIENDGGSITITNSQVVDNINENVINNGNGGSLDILNSFVRGTTGLVINTGTMHVTGSIIWGGTVGIHNTGAIDVLDTAIVHSEDGFESNGGNATIINSTISDITTGRGLSVGEGDFNMNFATVVTSRDGGNLPYFSTDGHHDVEHSILVRDCGNDSRFGISPGTNLGCADEELGIQALTEVNGTWVHPLDDDSPARDAAGRDCPEKDQRGVTRPVPVGGDCDIGAYEWEPSEVPVPLVPADTPTPEPSEAKAILNANCRYGPSTAYEVADTLFKDQTALITGRNEENTWWQIKGPTFGTLCWVSYVTVEVSGDVDGIPIGVAPPLPQAPSKKPPAAPKGCFTYDQNQNVVCTVPCPANPQPGGACTP